MHKAWLTRLNTLVLALLMAGGGSGLPVVDAVFHHLQAAPVGSRISDGEAPAAHGERCALGVPLPAMAVAGSVAAGPPALAVSFSAADCHRLDAPRLAAVPGITRPRAPPTDIG
jgi:hypothetical protein